MCYSPPLATILSLIIRTYLVKFTDMKFSFVEVHQKFSLSGAFTRMQKATICFVVSICLSVSVHPLPPTWNISALCGCIFTKFDIWVFFENLSRKFKFSLKSDKNNWYEDMCTFMIASLWIILKIGNVSGKCCWQNRNTRFMFSDFFPKKCLLWGSMEKYGTAGEPTGNSVIQRMRVRCWITKAANRHSEFVILVAFPRQ